MKMILFSALALVVLMTCHQSNAAIVSCRNEDGTELDWFTVYKLPKDKKADNEYIKKGTAYATFTSANENFVLSSTSINSTKSIAGQTLNILYNTNFNSTLNKIGYIMYNDQSPMPDASDSDARAHAKGVIIFDDKNVVWLVHSVPKFPPAASHAGSQYWINPKQCKYGQSMICMSMPISQLDTILKQLKIAWTQVYDFYIPPKHTMSQTLIAFANSSRIKDMPSSKETLTSNKGQQFIALHKSSKFGADLYRDLVGPELGSTVFAETWTNGVGTTPSNCSCPNSVFNINSIKLPYITFPNSKDHSKIGIVLSGKVPKYLCIGDINRQNSQTERGGGTICINNKQSLAIKYYSFINTVDGCDGKEAHLTTNMFCS